MCVCVCVSVCVWCVCGVCGVSVCGGVCVFKETGRELSSSAKCFGKAVSSRLVLSARIYIWSSLNSLFVDSRVETWLLREVCFWLFSWLVLPDGRSGTRCRLLQVSRPLEQPPALHPTNVACGFCHQSPTA